MAKGNAKAGYLFITPFIIGFLLFLVVPLVQSLRMSFCEVAATNGQGLKYKWVFLDKYKEVFFKDPDYVPRLLDNLKNMALFVPGILVFSFFMAILLNQEFKGRAIVRAIYFLPVILSSGIMLGLETNNSLLNSMKDAISKDNSLTSITKTLESILLTGEKASKFFEYVINLVNQVYKIAIASGIQIIIFLSGLQTISASMYEAADIEGCTAWEALWKITFPMISSLFLVNWIYTIIDFSMRSDNQLISKIQVIMAGQLNYGLASAMSWVYFLVVMAFIAITSFLISKGVYYYE